ncbi:MAG: LytTR family transcriptional regulator [Gammaproteobacteria bacterium]|nr:LytTR family transcriptional regulator [Gammaproteobacteria bacterium]
MTEPVTSLNSPHQNGRSQRQIIEFHLLLPFGVGLFLGAVRIGAQQFETIGHHMAYTALFSILSWLCYGLASKLMSWVLRPWQPPLLVILLTGYFVGGFGFWWPLRDVLNSFFVHALVPGSAFGSFWPPPAEDLAGYIAMTVQGLAWWLLANWLDFRLRRVPRFGFQPPAAPPAVVREESAPVLDSAATATSTGSQLPAEPRLVQRLPANLRGADIHALEAEEHYTKIHTSKGNTLLLMRFSDAIAEMNPQPGLQVHRSFWVSQAAVERVARVDQRWVIRVRGGLNIPVSRSYRVSVQSSGLLGGNMMGDD